MVEFSAAMTSAFPLGGSSLSFRGSAGPGFLGSCIAFGRFGLGARPVLGMTFTNVRSAPAGEERASCVEGIISHDLFPRLRRLYWGL